MTDLCIFTCKPPLGKRNAASCKEQRERAMPGCASQSSHCRGGIDWRDWGTRSRCIPLVIGLDDEEHNAVMPQGQSLQLRADLTYIQQPEVPHAEFARQLQQGPVSATMSRLECDACFLFLCLVFRVLYCLRANHVVKAKRRTNCALTPLSRNKTTEACRTGSTRAPGSRNISRVGPGCSGIRIPRERTSSKYIFSKGATSQQESSLVRHNG